MTKAAEVVVVLAVIILANLVVQRFYPSSPGDSFARRCMFYCIVGAIITLTLWLLIRSGYAFGLFR